MLKLGLSLNLRIRAILCYGWTVSGLIYLNIARVAILECNYVGKFGPIKLIRRNSSWQLDARGADPDAKTYLYVYSMVIKPQPAYHLRKDILSQSLLQRGINETWTFFFWAKMVT